MSSFADANRRHFLRSAVAGAAALAAASFGRRLLGAPDPGLPIVLAHESKLALKDEGPMPDFDGAVGWLNSAPLSRQSLRGKVVLVNFWTYSCINSLRPLPYVKSWAAKYRDAGLVVIGVHTPEFPFEEDQGNVARALREHSVAYPVPLDSKYTIWQAFNNEYWPAFYLIDGKGRIRHHQFGEGNYAEGERALQELLRGNGATGLDGSIVSISGDGVEAAPSTDMRSPETYVGYRQAERFASPERLTHDKTKITAHLKDPR